MNYLIYYLIIYHIRRSKHEVSIKAGSEETVTKTETQTGEAVIETEETNPFKRK